MSLKNETEPRFEVLIPDLNGIFRGLAAPLADADSLLAGVPWSSSLFSSRYDGAVVEETGRGLSCGDPDYPCHVVAGTQVPVPWRADTQQAVFAMMQPNGKPYAMDPQHLLTSLVACLEQDGMTPILATEFEFYLGRDNFNQADGQAGFSDLYSFNEIQRCAPFLDTVATAARQQGVPMGNIISEYGAGQWEINLQHTTAFRACLNGLLLRRIVRACAASCGKEATFMAKPFGGASGSGMHMHLSLWKEIKGQKTNLFANEETLMNAVAGVLAVCGEGMAFFAPYDNSYRRFMPGSYAPTTANWGRENRAATVRLPNAKKHAECRLEFRLCGADVNPMLAAAVMLAGVHYGIANKLQPPPSVDESTDAAAEFSMDWRSALNALKAAKVLPPYLGDDFLSNYLAVKESEWRHHRAHISDYDRLFYGRVI